MDYTTQTYLSFFSPPDSRPFVQTNAFFESRLQVIRPGSSLRLECSATGAPAPNLKWFLDDRLLKAVSLLVSVCLACLLAVSLRLDLDILVLGLVNLVFVNVLRETSWRNPHIINHQTCHQPLRALLRTSHGVPQETIF